MEQQYMSLKKAAAYCDYSTDHFRKVVLPGYDIPKYGPKRNKFRVIDLDAFMADPEAFREDQRMRMPVKRGRRLVV